MNSSALTKLLMGSLVAVALGWATAVMGYGERISALESTTDSVSADIQRVELKVDRVLELMSIYREPKRRER